VPSLSSQAPSLPAGKAALWLPLQLAEQFAQRSGDQARVGQRREVVARQLRHRPATLPRLGGLIRVGLA
jgi:hypothetical protein